MNFKLVLKYLSIIFFVLGLAFLSCLAIAIFTDLETDNAPTLSWIVSVGLSFILVIICHVLSRGASTKLFRREALCIIGIGWIAASLLGALPYWLIIDDFDVFDAIFEATSGITTTGASVIADVESLPSSLLFWRALSQWIGGLGIVVFFAALLSFIGAGAKILYSNEASGQWADMESARIQKTLFQILLIYIVLSAACCSAYYLEGMSLLDSFCHTFTTIATGGFSTKNTSMAYFNSAAIEWTAVIFMIIGGTSFLLILQVITGNIKTLWKNSEWLVYLSLITFFTAVITFVLESQYEDFSFYRSFRLSVFQVVSILTTSGFSTTDYNLAAPVAHVFLMILMITGGCSGSTSGGIKIIRVIGVIKICHYQVLKAFRPRLVRSIQIDGKPFERDAQESIMTHIAIAIVLALISLLIIAFQQPALSFEGNFSSVIACLLNIGPGFAEVGPASNYDFMQGQTKLFYALLMLIGRIEFLAVLVLFVPSFWKRYS